jgi:large subunit ribosomal protein L24
VLSGVERGKRGKVLQVLRRVNRVLVEGVNLRKKAMRKTQDNPQGGIIEREAPLHVSNVMAAAEYDSRRGNGAKEKKENKK